MVSRSFGEPPGELKRHPRKRVPEDVEHRHEVQHEHHYGEVGHAEGPEVPTSAGAVAESPSRAAGVGVQPRQGAVSAPPGKVQVRAPLGPMSPVLARVATLQPQGWLPSATCEFQRGRRSPSAGLWRA